MPPPIPLCFCKMSSLQTTTLLTISTTLILFMMTTTIHGSSSNRTCPIHPACGEARNFDIHYPFWLTDSTKTTNCGYPTFGLTCKDNKFPVFRLSNKDYYLTYIDYNENVIILLDIDFYKSPCPRPRQNFTISDNPILSYTQYDQNLTFFFNCSTSPSPSQTTSTSRPDCLGGRSYVTTGELGRFNGWDSRCEEAVVVPAVGYLVNKTAADLTNSVHQLSSGFGLGWKVPLECERCEGSGGVCLHENKSFSGCSCDGGVRTSDHCVDTGTKKSKISKKVLIGIITGVVIILAAAILIISIWRDSLINIICSKDATNDSIDVENFLKDYRSMILTKFTYIQIRRMTNNFREKLGQGGYGSVYKGKIPNGLSIAAKILENPKDNGQDFINEVTTIGRISHFNIIRLLGYCCEGSRRALVYEYMPNGSLKEFISNEKLINRLGREKMLDIAIGIANGIQYMHNGCDTRILHLDIKPQNILLDHDFHPKISDFGLAKLYSRSDNIVSLTGARGTVGYISPECFLRNLGGVSHKSDVYSYGMLLLDMIVGRNNNVGFEYDERSSMSLFPNWIYIQLERWREMEIDKAMVEEEGVFVAKKMVLVGLWCIQMNPGDRPSMNKVLEMLEGNDGSIETPPKPFFASTPGDLSMRETTTFSDSDGGKVPLMSESM